MQGKYTVTLIEGDGIGPEISQSVKDIFAAAQVSPEHAPRAGLRRSDETGPNQLGTGRCDPATERRTDGDPGRSD